MMTHNRLCKSPFVFDRARLRSYLLPLNYPWRTDLVVKHQVEWLILDYLAIPSCPFLIGAVDEDTLDEDGNTPGTSKKPEQVDGVQLHEG